MIKQEKFNFKLSLIFIIKNKKNFDFNLFFKIINKIFLVKKIFFFKLSLFLLKIGIFKFFLRGFLEFFFYNKKNYLVYLKIRKLFFKKFKKIKLKSLKARKIKFALKIKKPNFKFFFNKILKKKKKKKTFLNFLFLFFPKPNFFFFYHGSFLDYRKIFMSKTNKKYIQKNTIGKNLIYEKKNNFRKNNFLISIKEFISTKNNNGFAIFNSFEKINANHFDKKFSKFTDFFFKDSIKSLSNFFDSFKIFLAKNFFSCKNFQIDNIFFKCFIKKKKDFLATKEKNFFDQKKIKFIKNKTIFQINGKNYLKIEFIGKGGSGKIYKIIDPLGKIYALKKTRLNIIEIENVHNRINEISICKIFVNQKKIIQLKDADISLKNRLVFIIFEFGDCDLEYLIRKNAKKNLSKSFLGCFWKEIIDAVQIIHREGIIHGDLKPSNFLLVDNCLKLIDFGVSKLIVKNFTHTIRYSRIGTLNYMSPESILSLPYKKKKKFKLSFSADIWSLGCIFFQIVYGKPPFYHLNIHKKIKAIINKNFSILFLPLDINYAVDIIKNCLERNPQYRVSIDELKIHPFFN